MGEGVTKSGSDDSLIRIEETQAALRDSISRAKALAEESERLVRAHRQHRDAAAKPPNPA
jgi:hypothetical protein